MKATATFALFLAGFTAAGCGGAHPESGAPAAPPLRVAVGTAAEADLPSSFEAGGVVRARSTAMVASRILAPVVEVHVRAGDRVRRGAALATLDGREVRTAHAQASATLASAVQAAHAADADVAAAESALKLARASHDRIKSLHDKRSATPQELDQAVAALAAAEAQLGSSRARALAAAAAREAAGSSVQASEIGVTYTVLSAPFDGVVTERRVDPGTMAAPGVPLLVLEDPTAFRLEVQVDEARAARIAPGQSTLVRLDSTGSAEWKPARVAEIARIDPSSHSFLVKMELGPDPAIRSGLFGRARFPGPSRRGLTVPASALIRRGQLTFVFVIDGDAARLRAVVTGVDGPDLVEVLAGLRAGERVVLGPPPELTDGRRVAATAQPSGEPGGAPR
ncbi:MAG TPA: efflux RND transporter periplasmic adaptor subunit [Vicinamibacterales bacterium]|nr:efflux RND transporter periplasmic adaptor subunit [Vicinamibacterales bacterium]